MARLLVWLILGQYGYWPTTWTIEPRPIDPAYGSALWSHRRGLREPLEKLILQSIVSPD
jgi:hypothetical protein